MKSSTRLCKLLVLLCEAYNEKHPKKRKYTKRATVTVSERRYKKASKALAKLAVTPVTAEPVKRGRGRPRKVIEAPIVAAPVKRGPGRPRKVQPIETYTNRLNLTPEQQAKIDAIKAKIASLSSTLPSDRGES